MIRTATLIAAAASMALATPVAAEVVETSENHFVTRDAARIAASPRDVWLALTKPGDWWNDSHTWSGKAENMTLTPQAGGCFCERIPGEDGADGFAMDGSVQHAVVLQAYPMRALRLRGGLGPLQGEPATGVLTITMKEIPGGTQVLWEYVVGGAMRFEVPAISKAVDGVMSEQLQGLAAHLGVLGGEKAPADEPASEKASPPEADKSGDDTDETSVEAQIDALDTRDD